jgi:hypothetical protein
MLSARQSFMPLRRWPHTPVRPYSARGDGGRDRPVYLPEAVPSVAYGTLIWS